MSNGTPTVMELVVVARMACQALGSVALEREGQLYFSSISLTLNARLGDASRQKDLGAAYAVIVKALDEARSAVNRALTRESSVASVLKDASEGTLKELAEVGERLASLGAMARLRGSEAKGSTDRSESMVDVEIGAVGVRLLQYAQELEEWVSGRRPIPTDGPSATLKAALSQCALAFRRAAKNSRSAQA